MDINALSNAAVATLVPVAWRIAGAVALWLVARWLIAFALRLLGRALAQQQFDTTLARYMINNAVDHHTAITLLKQRLARIPNVLQTPAPDVDVLQFTAAGPLLCVRPYCRNEAYWQVYFDTNRMIREAFGEAGFPAPAPAYTVSGPPAPPPSDA